MTKAKGYAAQDPRSALQPFEFNRREVKANDVLIDILYCGICHSDIHQARNEWGKSIYPMVPGHEIVGKVRQIGEKVTRFKIDEIVGVGCLVNSCQTCLNCHEGFEQYCSNGFVGTYNGIEKGSTTPTYGGYSNNIVVNDQFVLKIPSHLPLSQVAPLLCAGITTYSPLRHWQVQKGQKVGVIGLGGLGHMAVKLAHAMGAEVVVFTTSPHKKEDALKMGANDVIISTQPNEMKKHLNTFDFILNTVSAALNLNTYLSQLKRDGKLIIVGISPVPPAIETTQLIFGRRTLAGSLIGGIAQTQEMLDFCGENNITCDVEVIPIQQINEAFERTIRSDVKYRFVIDMQSL